MINLTKTDEPYILKNNSENWNRDLIGELGKGTPISKISLKYNHKDIKAKLLEETRGKCAYCESKINHAAYLHIEHILPKTKFPELTYKWGNLTISCPKCNLNKGDYYEDKLPLLNPYQDQIDKEITFWGPSLQYITAKGKFTIYKLDLNRAELIERRAEKIDAMSELFLSYHDASIPVIREMYWKELDEMTKKEAEYSSLAYSLFNSRERSLH
ncbi:MAG: HNH endonuclease [Bacillota bacterium]